MKNRKLLVRVACTTKVFYLCAPPKGSKNTLSGGDGLRVIGRKAESSPSQLQQGNFGGTTGIPSATSESAINAACSPATDGNKTNRVQVPTANPEPKPRQRYEVIDASEYDSRKVMRHLEDRIRDNESLRRQLEAATTKEWRDYYAEFEAMRRQLDEAKGAQRHMEACRALAKVPNDEVLYERIKELQQAEADRVKSEADHAADMERLIMAAYDYLKYPNDHNKSELNGRLDEARKK